jgi:hypothetical protein
MAEHPLLDAIRNVDMDATSPRQAMELLQQWQEQLAGESASRVAAAAAVG